MKLSTAIIRTLKEWEDKRNGPELKNINDFYIPTICKEIKQRSNRELACSECPMIYLSSLTFNCSLYEKAASGDNYFRNKIPRWKEDILEMAIACKQVGD